MLIGRFNRDPKYLCTSGCERAVVVVVVVIQRAQCRTAQLSRGGSSSVVVVRTVRGSIHWGVSFCRRLYFGRVVYLKNARGMLYKHDSIIPTLIVPEISGRPRNQHRCRPYTDCRLCPIFTYVF